MRVFASTVGRNEADRWLNDMLASCDGRFDAHFFYDDGSTDDTPGIASSAGCTVVHRSAGPSFLEHEGRFRQEAWNAFEVTCQPEAGDWVLSIDCDEILLTDESDRLERLALASGDLNALLVPIPEVFGFLASGAPLVRTDGFWGTIRGTRFFQYRPGGRFSDKAMGSGSEPQYATRAPYKPAEGLWLMHLGYARKADQVAKHARYSAMQHGHNDAHVQSIVASPTVVPWAGPMPKLRGDSWVS